MSTRHLLDTIFNRDNQLCCICGKKVKRKQASLEHYIITRSECKSNHQSLVKLAHKECNNQLSDILNFLRDKAYSDYVRDKTHIESKLKLIDYLIKVCKYYCLPQSYVDYFEEFKQLLYDDGDALDMFRRKPMRFSSSSVNKRVLNETKLSKKC